MYINIYIPKYVMVNNIKIKIYAIKSRHSINLPSEFVRDSAFPFKVGESLKARIEGDKIIIEKELQSTI